MMSRFMGASKASGVVPGTNRVERVATQGGIAPAEACNAAMQSARKIVKYQADYIFWRQRAEIK